MLKYKTLILCGKGKHETKKDIADANSMAGYMSVLFCLNMHTDMEKVASDDVLGRELQDLQLPKRVHS